MEMYVPFRCGHSRRVMKNWELLVLGPLLAMHRRASESRGRVRSSSTKVPPYMDSPPVPLNFVKSATV